jgi:hypothetical protein
MLIQFRIGGLQKTLELLEREFLAILVRQRRDARCAVRIFKTDLSRMLASIRVGYRRTIDLCSDVAHWAGHLFVLRPYALFGELRCIQHALRALDRLA